MQRGGFYFPNTSPKMLETNVKVYEAFLSVKKYENRFLCDYSNEGEWSIRTFMSEEGAQEFVKHMNSVEETKNRRYMYRIKTLYK